MCVSDGAYQMQVCISDSLRVCITCGCEGVCPVKECIGDIVRVFSVYQ